MNSDSEITTPPDHSTGLLNLMLIVFALWIGAGCASQPPSSSHTTDSAALQQLFKDYWEDRLRLDPVLATMVGDSRYNDRLANDISEAHREQVREIYGRHLRQLRQFDPKTLSPRDRVNRDILAGELELALEGLRFDEHLLPVNQLFSLPVFLPQFGSGSGLHPFKTTRDYENFLSRLRDFETWVDTAIGNLRLGMAKGVVQPKAVMHKVQPQLEAMMVGDVTQSVFYKPVVNFPADVTETDRARLRTAYSEAIATRVIPTYQRLHTFIRDEYLPKCRDSVGWSELPQGREWYAYRVRSYTTTQMSLDEIFDLGEREVERLSREMLALQRQTGFQGDLLAFGLHLEKTDTNVVRTKPELLAAYERLRSKVEPQLPRLFNHMPKSRYEIRPVAEYQEGSVSDHYWAGTPDGSRPGVFFADGSNLAEKPRAASESLFLHEAVPGHHFETSLTQEQLDQPDFRRFAWFPAYSEGWALYCEGLGLELGCYEDPAQRMEWLAMDMWRARRLVVDVGMHAKGWTREEARQYLLKNPKAVMSADVEVDRYIADPGQALAYKIGERTIVRLRDEAARTLKTRFDIRTFHDRILDGAMPLTVMARVVDQWIAAGTASSEINISELTAEGQPWMRLRVRPDEVLIVRAFQGPTVVLRFLSTSPTNVLVSWCCLTGGAEAKCSDPETVKLRNLPNQRRERTLPGSIPGTTRTTIDTGIAAAGEIRAGEMVLTVVVDTAGRLGLEYRSDLAQVVPFGAKLEMPPPR